MACQFWHRHCFNHTHGHGKIVDEPLCRVRVFLPGDYSASHSYYGKLLANPPGTCNDSATSWLGS
jgi:hypothetical protein